MAGVEELPEELMTLILLKLPVKSLLRFKCVHKSWYSLIKSPQFVHLHRSSSSSSSSSINYDCFLVKRRHVLSFFSYETLDDLGNEINIPISSSSRFGAVFCGSCDGLVCVSNYDDQILICNPSIRELRSLFVPPSFGISSGYRIGSIAFGSDPNTGQFTVVMIGVPYDFGDREARLYDFSTNSWRKTAAVFPPGPFLYSRCAVLLNGAFHWCPWDDDDSNILTFRISNEVTQFIPLPDFAEVTHDKELCVSSKSQLSLILYNSRGGRFEICVMTEYGVKESWTRLLFIEPPLFLFEPMAFWDEQRLLAKTPQGQLVSCDLQYQNLCRFPIDGDFDLYPFSQSLVSVFGMGHPIISIGKNSSRQSQPGIVFVRLSQYLKLFGDGHWKQWFISEPEIIC